jgi:hypothetical protein
VIAAVLIIVSKSRFEPKARFVTAKDYSPAACNVSRTEYYPYVPDAAFPAQLCEINYQDGKAASLYYSS